MSKLTIKIDGKSFCTFLPNQIAEARFLELCKIAMENQPEKNMGASFTGNSPISVKIVVTRSR